MYAEASLQLPGAAARLVSPVFAARLSEAACVRARVSLRGADIGSLELGQTPESGQTEGQVGCDWWTRGHVTRCSHCSPHH